jgi:ubiquinone/menaquinone biosynthesis C-methylase UbiE
MNGSPPTPDFIAAQLRKPSGDFAATIAQTMDKTNEFLFGLTLQSMDLHGDEHLLEIGFGSGRFLHKLFSRRDAIRVHGIDYSPEMVALAREINGDLVNTGVLALEEGHSGNLPFDDEAFDMAFCNMVIYFWDNPDEHLREVWRVLGPAGTFYAGFRTKESMMHAPFVRYGFHLYTQEEWKALLERNGFVLLRTVSKTDPTLEMNGQRIQLESVCMVAQKSSRLRGQEDGA